MVVVPDAIKAARTREAPALRSVAITVVPFNFEGPVMKAV